jgi:dienelactone hydrolase
MNRSFHLRIFALLAVFISIAARSPAAETVAGFVLDGDQWTLRDGETQLDGILLKPEGKGPFPAIVISHGLGGNAKGFGRQAAREFLKMGFVCIATNYTHNADAVQARRADGGSGGKHPPDFGASPENIKRAMKCIAILESLPYVDKKRIAAYGHSMGAFLTIALAAEVPDRIRAAAISAGGLSGRPGYPAPTKEVAQKIRTPFCILHGTADTTVRPEQSAELKTVLDANKVPNERHLFEGVAHNLNHVRAEECGKIMRAWFIKHGVARQADG